MSKWTIRVSFDGQVSLSILLTRLLVLCGSVAIVNRHWHHRYIRTRAIWEQIANNLYPHLANCDKVHTPTWR